MAKKMQLLKDNNKTDRRAAARFIAKYLSDQGLFKTPNEAMKRIVEVVESLGISTKQASSEQIVEAWIRIEGQVAAPDDDIDSQLPF